MHAHARTPEASRARSHPQSGGFTCTLTVRPRVGATKHCPDESANRWGCRYSRVKEKRDLKTKCNEKNNQNGSHKMSPRYTQTNAKLYECACGATACLVFLVHLDREHRRPHGVLSVSAQPRCGGRPCYRNDLNLETTVSHDVVSHDVVSHDVTTSHSSSTSSTKRHYGNCIYSLLFVG